MGHLAYIGERERERERERYFLFFIYKFAPFKSFNWENRTKRRISRQKKKEQIGLIKKFH